MEGVATPQISPKHEESPGTTSRIALLRWFATSHQKDPIIAKYPIQNQAPQGLSTILDAPTPDKHRNVSLYTLATHPFCLKKRRRPSEPVRIEPEHFGPICRRYLYQYEHKRLRDRRFVYMVDSRDTLHQFCLEYDLYTFQATLGDRRGLLGVPRETCHVERYFPLPEPNVTFFDPKLNDTTLITDANVQALLIYHVDLYTALQALRPPH